MNTVVVQLPCMNTWSGVSGVGQFLQELGPYWECPDSVKLDLSRCRFISAEGTAVLTTFQLGRQARNASTTIDWSTVDPVIGKQLGRWNVSPLFGQPSHRWTDNAIPLLHQQRLDAQALVAYVDRWIRAGQNMPVMTDPLAKKVRESFCELFQNAFLHANSSCGVIAIGQLYPNAKEVQVCVCDGGIGVVQKVRQAGHGFANPADAIAWALNEGTTTRHDPAGPPGGLGLFLLREFVKINGGTLRIVANDGYFCQVGATTTRETLPSALPGSLVQVKLQIRDDVIYALASA